MITALWSCGDAVPVQESWQSPALTAPFPVLSRSYLRPSSGRLLVFPDRRTGYPVPVERANRPALLPERGPAVKRRSAAELGALGKKTNVVTGQV